MGVQYATAWIHDEAASADDYTRRQRAFADAGLTLYDLGNGAVHNQDDIVLNLPQADRHSPGRPVRAKPGRGAGLHLQQL